MSNYETIKDCALQFMTRNKINSIHYEKEDYQKYYHYKGELKKEISK